MNSLREGLRAKACVNIPRAFLLVGFLICAISAPAQILKTLHGFSVADGMQAVGPLVLSSNILYGTTSGSFASNTVFAISTNGTGFKVLHSFAAADGVVQPGLALSGKRLYGATFRTATNGGTIFAINVDGIGFTNLHTFAPWAVSQVSMTITNSDGVDPWGSMALLGDTLYGTTGEGGSAGCGTLFAIDMNGTGFTNLHSFTTEEGWAPNPISISSGILYGTTYGGQSPTGPLRNPVVAGGSVFSLKLDGSGFRNLHVFSRADGASTPSGSLVVSGDMLYGCTAFGGTVFGVKSDGTDFRILHDFTADDGSGLQGGLVLWHNTLYGNASGGGVSGKGIVFSVNTDGASFATLHSFSGADGAAPSGGLVRSGNTLYGTTRSGGSWYGGTVFSLTVNTELSVISYGGYLLLTWPTIPTGFTLQSITNLDSPVWSTVAPPPVTANGQNMVIRPSSGALELFRLAE